MRKADTELSRISKNGLLLQMGEVRSACETVEGSGGGARHPGDVARGQRNRVTQGHPCPEVLYQNKKKGGEGGAPKQEDHYTIPEPRVNPSFLDSFCMSNNDLATWISKTTLERQHPSPGTLQTSSPIPGLTLVQLHAIRLTPCRA